MFGRGSSSTTLYDIKDKVSQIDLALRYFGVKKIPCLICSPLREDNNPSFGFYTRDGVHVYWTDFATKEHGDIYNLLQRLWNCSLREVASKIESDLLNNNSAKPLTQNTKKIVKKVNFSNDTDLQCKVRPWMQHDIDYWGSYGITIDQLKYADVWPISYKIIVKNGVSYPFKADKYAYAYVERKEGRITLKIYQPFNTQGYKWSNKHDKSVVSLWTKIPEKGDKVVICSSLKDALCLWSNTGIPALAVQGEGYDMSETAIRELYRRYNSVYVLFDNDAAGIADAIKFSSKTGFTNIELPQFKEGKDISDLYKAVGKEKFLEIIMPLFNSEWDDLPF